MRASRGGFTIVELAVVLAVIGLLVGGILGGQALLRSSEVNRALLEAGNYRIALEQFRTQYEYYPGDFPTAVKLWGKADGDTNLSTNCASPATNVSIGTATCNGNGDGNINANYEAFRAWQQMAVAGLVVGKYTGVTGPALAFHVLPGTNTPAGAISGTAYFIWNWGIVPADTATFFAGNYNNVLIFGKARINYYNDLPAFSSTESYLLDNKVDDGYPGTGDIRTLAKNYMDTYGNLNCISTGIASTSRYVRTIDPSGCFLVFMQTFKRVNAQ